MPTDPGLAGTQPRDPVPGGDVSGRPDGSRPVDAVDCVNPACAGNREILAMRSREVAELRAELAESQKVGMDFVCRYHGALGRIAKLGDRLGVSQDSPE